MMMKGVNRKVIEINHPESDYFERAVLYLRPDVNEAPIQAARMEAQALLGMPSRKRSRLSGWICFLLGAAASGSIFALLMLLKWWNM